MYSPVLHLSAHGRTADVVGKMDLSEAVAVEDDRKHGRIAVEEVLRLFFVPKYRVVVEAGEKRPWPPTQRVLKRLKMFPSDVDLDALSRHDVTHILTR